MFSSLVAEPEPSTRGSESGLVAAASVSYGRSSNAGERAGGRGAGLSYSGNSISASSRNMGWAKGQQPSSIGRGGGVGGGRRSDYFWRRVPIRLLVRAFVPQVSGPLGHGFEESGEEREQAWGGEEARRTEKEKG